MFVTFNVDWKKVVEPVLDVLVVVVVVVLLLFALYYALDYLKKDGLRNLGKKVYMVILVRTKY